MYPDVMPAYLRRHDDLLCATIEEHNGRVFKTVGDEVCAVFARTQDALNAAAAAQYALATHDWSEVGGLRVRMAVHCGPVTQRDGDYFGSTVNHVARLLAAGHGGQVLVSADAAKTLDAAETSRLRDLGRHRLKDFPEMQTIFQLLALALPDIFPPLRTIAERPSNLPQHLTALLGRERDVEEVTQQLASARLVTIAGAGGVGKTSLALQIGANTIDGYEDGAWLAELAPMDAGSVTNALAAVFGVTGLAGGTVLDALIAQLKNKQLLLILDNCEHVVTAAASAATVILHNCPGVRILATSREALSVAGESVYRLPVLAVPPPSALSAEDVLRYGACELFQERARAHSPAFSVTDENARTVGAMCRRLDGIPLAIELAAARLRVLNVTQLAEKLNERFRLLTGGSRTALPHHQTLRALIQWSYELLAENERLLLQRSAVFLGGWTIGAAVDVCTDDEVEEWDVLDHLAGLADKSLIATDDSGDEPRYRMLESTREYALERLEESGLRSSVARKHAQHFAALAERADDAWAAAPAKLWIAPLEVELDNLRAALTWCVSQHNDVSLGMRMFGALEAFWWDAQPVEGRRWIEELRPFTGQDEFCAQAPRFWLATAGIALSTAQEKYAVAAAAKALELYRAANDELGVAAANRARGAALIRLGKLDEGEAATREALEVLRKARHGRLTALALRTLATAPILRGDLATAGEIYREALALSQALADERGIQIISGNLAEIDACAGNYESAIQHGTEALKIARERRDWVMVCTLLINVTAYLLAVGRLSEGRSSAREAFTIAREIESEIHTAVAIQHLAAIEAHCGDASRAARLIGYVDAAYARLGNSREPTEGAEYERTMAQLGDRLSASDLLANVRAGSGMSVEQAQHEALMT